MKWSERVFATEGDFVFRDLTGVTHDRGEADAMLSSKLVKLPYGARVFYSS